MFSSKIFGSICTKKCFSRCHVNIIYFDLVNLTKFIKNTSQRIPTKITNETVQYTQHYNVSTTSEKNFWKCHVNTFCFDLTNLVKFIKNKHCCCTNQLVNKVILSNQRSSDTFKFLLDEETKKCRFKTVFLTQYRI